MASTNRCTYCGKEFAKARTLQVHLCEPKRRYLQKDEKWVVNAFMVFQRFYQIHQHNAKLKTYDEFKRSAILDLIEITLQRYCNHFSDGGHEDSALDLTVYASMLVEIDRMIKNRDKRHNLPA